jgi:Uma2 family endonuclease
MDFVQDAPTFAVEIRSRKDYGLRAERAIRDKIKDYFAAGTKIVWDVDLLGEAPIRKFASETPDDPVTFYRGETADAEPAVPGWRFPVDRLFRMR